MSEGMSNWEGPKDPVKKGNKETKKSGNVGVELELHVDRNDPLNKKMLEERGLVVGKDGKLYPKKGTTKTAQSENGGTKIIQSGSAKKTRESLDKDLSDSEKSLEEARLLFEQEVNKRIAFLQPLLRKYRDSTSLTIRLPNKTGGKMIGKDGEKELSIGYRVVDGAKTIYAEKSDGKSSIYEGYTVLSEKVIKFTIKNGKQEKTVCTVDDMLAFVNSDKTSETLNKLTSFVSGNSTYQPQFLKNESSAIDPLSIYSK